MLLTALGRKAVGSTPVLKETVQARTILENVGGVDDAKTPSLCTVALGAIGECRVCVCRVGCEGNQRVRIGLEVGCLLLYGAHEDVRGMRKLVVVQHRMFGRCSVQPNRTVLALEKEAPAIDVSLLLLGIASTRVVLDTSLTSRCIYPLGPSFLGPTHDQLPSPTCSPCKCWPARLHAVAGMQPDTALCWLRCP